MQTPAAPLILLIPGLLRSERAHARLLADWRTRHEVVVWHLPGHLRARAASPGLKPILAQLRHTVGAVLQGRSIVIAGESLGGLVAMLLAVNDPPPNLRSVVAFDPPIHPGASEALHGEIAALWAENPRSEIMQDYAGPIFGHPLSGVRESRDYRGVLRHRPVVPVHVVVGDALDRPGAASVVDGDVREMVAAAPGYALHTTTGGIGHDILAEAPEQATEALAVALSALDALHDA